MFPPHLTCRKVVTDFLPKSSAVAQLPNSTAKLAKAPDPVPWGNHFSLSYLPRGAAWG